ncbi:hypothetical protein FOXB_10336 [Fusarium oxysporum f. sp. conglutinans Fo5176]|uniref:Uncharacterized protein n=1 Tax=Fusarium oxysporum (strain Fo5176) TaxID=660025 RepID=F9FVA5_FUSOF|nr:hypothetical protein FOXB_10336 [Fusarium oxysporum f. sp. conglutinans Fo5176]
MKHPLILHEIRGFYQFMFSEWLQDQTKKFVVYNQIIT